MIHKGFIFAKFIDRIPKVTTGVTISTGPVYRATTSSITTGIPEASDTQSSENSGRKQLLIILISFFCVLTIAFFVIVPIVLYWRKQHSGTSFELDLEEVDFTDIKELELIGEGTKQKEVLITGNFGKVYRGTWKGKEVAVKHVFGSTSLSNEMKILRLNEEFNNYEGR